MATERFPAVFIFALAAVLLTGCRPLDPRQLAESRAENHAASTSEEVLYVATSGTILAFRVEGQNPIELIDSISISRVSRLRVAKSGRYLMAISAYPSTLSAIRLQPDGRFSGTPFPMLKEMPPNLEDIDIAGDGEFVVTIHPEAIPCEKVCEDLGLYHGVLSVHAISDLDQGLETATVFQTRFKECRGDFCTSIVRFAPNQEIQGGDYVWLSFYDQAGSLNPYTSLAGWPLDRVTGELGAEKFESPYGLVIPFNEYVIGVKQGYSPWHLAGHIFPNATGEPLWICEAEWSEGHWRDEGCGAPTAYAHPSLPLLFTITLAGDLWTFPFSPMSGPDVSRANRTALDVRPRDWFLLPDSKLLVGFGDSLTQFDSPYIPARVMFAFRVDGRSGELESLAGELPKGVAAITYRPAQTN